MTNYMEQQLKTLDKSENKLRSRIEQDIQLMQRRLAHLSEEVASKFDPVSTQLAGWSEEINNNLAKLEGLQDQRRVLENIEHDMMSDEQYNEMSTAADEHAAEIDQD